MRKFLLLSSFLAIAPLFLIFCIFYLSVLSFQAQSPLLLSFVPEESVAYAALPTNQQSFEEEIQEENAKVEIVRQFFAKYNSPLEPFASHIVNTADKYELDYRLLPAIAMQESNLCRRAPQDSYNCWGYGIYGGKVLRFNDYPHAIETITKVLATKYKDVHGLNTPEEIVTRYTPSDNGKWVNAVTHFMDQLQ